MRDPRERLPVPAPRPTGGQSVAALTGISLVSAVAAGCLSALSGAGPVAVAVAVWTTGWLSCLLWVGLLVVLSAVRGRRHPLAGEAATAPTRRTAWADGPVVRLHARQPDARG